MKFGICIGMDSEKIRALKKYGYDYAETSFSAIAKATDEEFEKFRTALETEGLKAECANGFLPGELRVTGNSVNNEALASFIEKGMERCRLIGTEIVVFGSSGARRIDAETCFTKGTQQLVSFLKDIAAPIAEKYGITIVLEPLCNNESNIVNTVKEGVMIAAMAECKNLGGLADLYHMHVENDSIENIRDLKGSLLHSHISNPLPRNDVKRCYPLSVEEYDYVSFIRVLKEVGCKRCSIEAATSDFDTDAQKAADLVQRLKEV